MSHELSAAIVWLGATAALLWLGSGALAAWSRLARSQIGGQAWRPVDATSVVELWRDWIGQMGRTLLPFLLLCFAVACVARLAQVGFIWAPTRLIPVGRRISPMQGLARIASMASLFRIAAALSLWVVVLVVGGGVLWGQRTSVLSLMSLDVPGLAATATRLVTDWVLKIGMILLLFGILDYAYRRWRYELDLRMTPEELRAEVKAVEGNPQVTSGRRDLHRELKQRTAEAE